MSFDTALARVSHLNAALSPQPTQPVAKTAAVNGKFSSALKVATGPTTTLGTPAGNANGILGAAASQLGVTEEPPGSNDSPRIAQFRQATAGNPGPGPWCAYFVSWAAKQSGHPIGPNGSGLGSVDAVWNWAQGEHRTTPASGTPKPGDLVVWDEHIGIVENILPNGQIQTIEGNTSDRVARRTHTKDGVVGFVRMS